MENILLMYRGNHASQRLMSATVAQYEADYAQYKGKFSLFTYCINKRNQQALNRFIDKYEIDIVYIHEEEKQSIVDLELLNVKYIEFTRSSFISKHTRGYKTIYSSTLIDELISKDKEKHGKIKVYYNNPLTGNIEEKEIFKVDYENHKNSRNWFMEEESAKNARLVELEKSIERKEKHLAEYIKKQNKDIEKLRAMKNKLM